MSGTAIIAIFFVLAALMYARLLPALLAVPLLALAIGAASGAGFDGIARIVADGTVLLAPVFVTVILGATLGRVTMETGIAERIVNVAAEFGGDQPAVLALALCAAVAVLFTSLTGLGAIIMVGSIVLPIMMTVGVPRKLAATLFLLAYGLGFIFNLGQWQFYQRTFGVAREQMQGFAGILALIEVAAVLVFALIGFRRARGYATWAVAAPEQRKRTIPAFALITPLVPLVIYFSARTAPVEAAGLGTLFGNPLVAFAIAALYGVLATRPRLAVKTLVASLIRGTEDVAPAVLLFMGIGMLLAATHEAPVRAALEPLVAAIAPRSAFAYVFLFGGCSWLALYRGPLNPYGVGILVYTVLAGLGVLPPVMLVAAIMAVVQVQNVCDPTNTQNVWIANFTGVKVDEIAKMTLPLQVAVATLAAIAAVVFARPLLHVPEPFGALPVHASGARPERASQASFFGIAQPANAATLDGLYAPASAADTIAVRGRGPFAAVAAHTVLAEVARGWEEFHAVPLDGDPAAAPCAGKAYVAVLTVEAAEAVHADAREIDSDVYLADCAGWPVDEFHDRDQLTHPATGDDIRRSVFGTLLRVRIWTREHPAEAHRLFTRGLAVDPAAPEAHDLFSFFKTNDGNMRAFVRPGGGAWAAGLRTDDVIDKIDGKWWWEYGTYQSQLRAYDGKPHSVQARRGDRRVVVELP